MFYAGLVLIHTRDSRKEEGGEKREGRREKKKLTPTPKLRITHI